MAVDMSQHFTYSKLAKFALPTIGMMLFMSTYAMVDGFFVSNFAGRTALAAVNFVYPILMIMGTVGFMLGTGGSAVVAKTRGEGDDVRANRQFSLLVYAAITAAIAFTAIGFAALRPLLELMGAEGALLEGSTVYGVILMVGVPFSILQYLFQELLITAGKPGLGFAATVAAGVTNIVLDAVFVAGFGWGLRGAAAATVIGMAVGGIAPLVYFARPNRSFLRLGAATLDWRTLGHMSLNGSSEMVSNIAMSVVAIAYNMQLLKYLGDSGVAAYGVIMYASGMFVAIFMGYIVGTAPLMSFQYGAKNRVEMQSLFRKSMAIVAGSGLLMFAAVQILARTVAQIFVGYDASLVELTVHAARFFAPAVLLMGFNMYASALFTSLGNGAISAVISFVRTFICEIAAVLLLPLWLGSNGIWLSVVVAEIVALALAGFFVFRFAPRYQYIPMTEAASGPMEEVDARGVSGRTAGPGSSGVAMDSEVKTGATGTEEGMEREASSALA